MEFAPAIDPRLIKRIGRTADLRSSAEVWRGLRRPARRFGITTPCYESVRKRVVAERERRARVLAAITTLLELASRRVPVLPEHVPLIYARRLAESRDWLRSRPRPPARAFLKRRGPPFGGPRSR